MTRKRFIKLLISRGERPREAIAIALRYNARGVPYKEAWHDYLLKNAILTAFARFERTAKVFSTSLAKTAKSFEKLSEALKS